MSLITDIQNIVAALSPQSEFMFASKFKANVSSYDLDIAKLPFIILDNELSKEAEIKTNNNIIKSTRIVITILNKDDVFNSDLESQGVIDGCELIADRIVSNIYQLSYIYPAGNQKYTITPAIHIMNTDLSGVIIDMRVNENTVTTFCNEIPN